MKTTEYNVSNASGFSGLPHDILCLICEELQDDRETLCCLAKVCRRISDIVRPMVFWHIDKVRWKRREALIALFEERPELKTHVRSIGPISIDDDGRPFRDRDLEDEDPWTWLGFPNLRHVTLERKHEDERYRRRRLETESLETAPKLSLLGSDHSKLRSIKLSTWGFYHESVYSAKFSATDIVHLLLTLPHLRCLQAEHLIALGEPQIPESLRGIQSNVTTLELCSGYLGNHSMFDGEHWSCKPEHFHKILAVCPKLRTLRCCMPIFIPYTAKDENTVDDCIVSPSALQDMVVPVRETLETLAIYTWKNEIQFDGTLMDFSDYPALEDLEINACCLLPPGAPGPERHELYLRLPSKLKTLELQFPRESGVLYYSKEYDDTTDPPTRPFETQPYDPTASAERTAWLRQFPAKKAANFPFLSSVTFDDPLWYDIEDSWNHQFWVSDTTNPYWSTEHSELFELYRSSGIELMLYLATPEQDLVMPEED